MGKIERIQVAPEDRERLVRLVRDRNKPQKIVWRSQIVLLAGEGIGAVIRARIILGNPRDAVTIRVMGSGPQVRAVPLSDVRAPFLRTLLYQRDRRQEKEGCPQECIQ